MTDLRSNTLTSGSHKTHYWEYGPDDGPLMIFIHGWPGIGLMWRTQLEFFAAQGWRCIAPDMRGYGGTSMPPSSTDYRLSAVVQDMVDLHRHLGEAPAIWVGHDWGSPVVGALSAHHRSRSRGTVMISVPYFPEGFALPSLLPLVDRSLYPADEYPNGQWDYYHFYLTNFDQTVSDADADIEATLASLYRKGNPASSGEISPSALITKNGGRYGVAHRAPATVPDPDLWPVADFAELVEAFHTHGFRSANAWYLNDADNVVYAKDAQEGGRLIQPVLYINGTRDAICDINRSALGEPMRQACPELSVTDIASGHWLPLERKTELSDAITAWLASKGL